MTLTITDTTASPYLLEAQPASSDRVLLARGFEHYCALHWGLSGKEIYDALTSEGDQHIRVSVTAATRLIGGMFAKGSIRGWVRPFGGGQPIPLRPNAWELDDFSARFATSAINFDHPYDENAKPTHWIFADLDDWNSMIDASVSEITTIIRNVSTPKRPPDTGQTLLPSIEKPLSTHTEGRLLRLPEIKLRTGLSRSTIYRKMNAGSFPCSVEMSGNITVWREDEVAKWIASPL